ncbi:unnamed protein product [Vitrella brassicaformis CCMP3155]|uniref:H-type lectin domain-containing protein n=1 Tax=Vitrella brassicaformis (strain CCMP3155) TaxID=1169540 RepID=A0A0G4GVK6_VITBC|nr:unnamed protein product [Vitrella brassicaformis CCMP3155]|eukprot:CEM34983.1 unnamed protein product [Vitrella brassicaformis CCMP3155]
MLRPLLLVLLAVAACGASGHRGGIEPDPALVSSTFLSITSSPRNYSIAVEGAAAASKEAEGKDAAVGGETMDGPLPVSSIKQNISLIKSRGQTENEAAEPPFNPEEAHEMLMDKNQTVMSFVEADGGVEIAVEQPPLMPQIPPRLMTRPPRILSSEQGGPNNTNDFVEQEKDVGSAHFGFGRFSMNLGRSQTRGREVNAFQADSLLGIDFDRRYFPTSRHPSEAAFVLTPRDDGRRVGVWMIDCYNKTCCVPDGWDSDLIMSWLPYPKRAWIAETGSARVPESGSFPWKTVEIPFRYKYTEVPIVFVTVRTSGDFQGVIAHTLGRVETDRFFVRLQRVDLNVDVSSCREQGWTDIDHVYVDWMALPAESAFSMDFSTYELYPVGGAVRGRDKIRLKIPSGFADFVGVENRTQVAINIARETLKLEITFPKGQEFSNAPTVWATVELPHPLGVAKDEEHDAGPIAAVSVQKVTTSGFVLNSRRLDSQFSWYPYNAIVHWMAIDTGLCTYPDPDDQPWYSTFGFGADRERIGCTTPTQ